MTPRRRPARRRLLGRLRALAQSWLTLVAVIGAITLVVHSLLLHRIDSLSVQRVRLEEHLEKSRHDLERAQMLYARHSSYETVVARAKREHGLVECAPGAQKFLALPSERSVESHRSWLGELASRLDRFGDVRGVLAAEEERR